MEFRFAYSEIGLIKLAGRYSGGILQSCITDVMLAEVIIHPKTVPQMFFYSVLSVWSRIYRNGLEGWRIWGGKLGSRHRSAALRRNGRHECIVHKRVSNDATQRCTAGKIPYHRDL
jgi:hypothetical protein